MRNYGEPGGRGHECGCVFGLSADERNQRYLLMASKGLKPESVGNVSLQVGEGLVGLVGQREEIVNLDNAPKHERFLYLPETGEEIYNSF